MAINLETLQIQFEIRDNTGSKLQKLEKQLQGIDDPKIGIDTKKAKADLNQFEKQAKKMKGASMPVDADTKEAQQKIEGLEKAAKGLEGTTVTVGADTKEALQGLRQMAQETENIPSSPTITPEVNTTPAENSLKGLWNMMKAMGLLKLGKEVFEFGMSAVNEAYAAQAVKNQIGNLGGTAAQDRIDAFTEEMNAAYGMNETGLAEMAKNFTAVYKGTGMDLNDALDKGIEMARMAIDYASALDKTPGEIADIFMSVLRGNTEVADSAGIYGLTADALSGIIDDMSGLTELENELADIERRRAIAENALSKSRAGSAQAKKEKQRIKDFEEQEKALKAQIEQQKKLNEETLSLDKAVAFFDIVKKNTETMGFAGDWARTYEEFGNQSTLLGENWKTLKANVGEFLTPAATEATLALNSLMQSVSGWLETMGESTFSKQLSDYFGTATLSKEEQQKIIDGIVGPVKGINDGVAVAMTELDGTISKYRSAHTSLISLLNLFYGTGEVDEEQIDAAYEEYKKAGLEALKQGESTLIDMFTAYTGTEEQWTDARDAGIAGIEAYYQGLTETINAKHEAFQKMLDAAMADGTFTQAELSDLKRAALETTQTTLKGSQISYGAATQQYLDDLQRSGEFSSKTIDELYSGAFAAAADERAQMEADYKAMRQKVYEVAEANRIEYEQDPTAYIAKHGKAPATAQEMLAGAQAEYDQALAQMEANLTNQISRFVIGGVENIGKQLKSGMSYSDFLEEIVKPMSEFESLVERIRASKSAGLNLSEESLSLLNFYDAIMSQVKNTPDGILGPGYYEFSQPKNPSVMEGGWISDANIFPSIPDSSAVYAGMTASAENFQSAVDTFGAFTAALPERIVVESHLNIGGYEFGQVVTESLNNYNTSTG